MASLHDQSFNREAWVRLGLVAVAVLGVGGLIFGSVVAHRRLVEVPRLLEARHSEPVGNPGRVTTQIAQLGAEAVETLTDDVRDTKRPASERRKSLEVLSGIDDARVLPLLGEALQSEDVGLRLAAVAGVARHGKPAGAELLWALLPKVDEWQRQRVIIALGLVATGDHVAKLVASAAATSGDERVLFAWAAGQAQRRSTDLDQIGRLPPAPPPQDDDDERRIQAEVDAVLASLAAGEALAENGLKLARLTAIEFGTWDQAHQISYQTIAVRGPMALRGGARIERDRPSELQGLELKRVPASSRVE